MSTSLSIRVSKAHLTLLVLAHFACVLVIGLVVGPWSLKAVLFALVAISALFTYNKFRHNARVDTLELVAGGVIMVRDGVRSEKYECRPTLVTRVLLVVSLYRDGERWSIPLFFDSLDPQNYRKLVAWLLV